MTTSTQQLPAILTPMRGFAWRQLGLAFGLTLLAIGVFGGAFAVGYASLHAAKVVPGVQIGGVPLAGLDRPAAEAALREQLPSLNDGHVTVQFAERQTQIGYHEIDRDYDMAAMLDQAFTIGRQGTIFDQVADQLHLLLRGANLESRVGWNDAALAAQVAALAESVYVAPSDALIVRQGGRWVVIPAVEGRTIDLQVAQQRVVGAIDNISAADTQVVVEATVLAPAVSTSQAQSAVDQADLVTERSLAIVGGGHSEVLAPELLRTWVHLQPAGVGAWEMMIGREAIEQWVAALALEVDRPAIEASFKLQGGEVRPVHGQTGLLVDVPATTEEIYAHLQLRGGGETPPPAVNMAMTVTTPEFTTEEAVLAAPRVEMVSAWTTKFVPGEANFFGANIHIPSAHLDGTVVPPGGTFDFWGLMPPSLADLPGIGPGGIIRNGKTDLTGAIGGGICSVSTTVFNAAARAGLQIGARRNHSYYIDRYPVGLDATVWRSSSAQQNMTFVNDTPYPLLVINVNRSGSVRFEIWTVPNGRKVDFSEPRIENRVEAKDYFEYTDELAPGQQQRLEYVRPGFESWVTRTVRDAAGNIIHQETFYSKYKTINGITLVGRYAGDPPAGTRVLRSEFKPTSPAPDPEPEPSPEPSPSPNP
jgi:vancomycin resistance protein YoaR